MRWAILIKLLPVFDKMLMLYDYCWFSSLSNKYDAKLCVFPCVPLSKTKAQTVINNFPMLSAHIGWHASKTVVMMRHYGRSTVTGCLQHNTIITLTIVSDIVFCLSIVFLFLAYEVMLQLISLVLFSQVHGNIFSFCHRNSQKEQLLYG